MRVVDASLVLGWLLREPLPAGHQRLLDEHVSGAARAVAPELLHYEVGNVLARGAGLSAAAARSGYERFATLEVETYALSDREYRRALELALTYRITVYDASYLALARALKIRLATADRRLERRVRDTGLVDVV